jgi:uncharacterized protein
MINTNIQENFKNTNILIAIIIGLSIIIFGFVLKGGFDNFSNKTDTITVTGSTEREVVSDLAKWNITLTEKIIGGETAGRDANLKIEGSYKVLENYLIKNGIKKETIQTGAPTLAPICEVGPQGYENCAIGTKGQTATKNITIESSDINGIKKLSDKAVLDLPTVNMQNNTVEYLYNNLKNIRAEMLSEATKNARERPEAVATAGGASLGKITSLSSGVFQVTAKNSIEVDGYGAYDTGSIDKKITATVKANFSVK